MTPTIINANCLDALRDMPDNSVDAVITDPPYGLSNTTPDKVADTIVRWASGDREHVPTGKGFMGANWDSFVPPPAVWDECYRVLKPGGHMAVFAGARTQDLMGLSIRLAGFDLRDSLSWNFGSGFPKSHNVGKVTGKPEHEGLGTALKPGHEPIIRAQKPFGKTDQQPIFLARKPLQGTVAANVTTWGTGAINIAACRITPSGASASTLPTSQGDAGSNPCGSTERTAPGPEASRTSRSLSTPQGASSDASPEGRSGPRPSASGRVSSYRRSPDSRSGCPSSPCSCGEHAPTSGADARGAAPSRSGAHELLCRCGASRRSPNHQSMPCNDCTTGDVERVTLAGRFPANVALDEYAAHELDQQSGTSKDGVATNRNRGERVASTVNYANHDGQDHGYGGQGGASRFFKVVEPDTAFREDLKSRTPRRSESNFDVATGRPLGPACLMERDVVEPDPPFMYAAKAPKRERPNVDGVAHPTVKPLALMRWLVRLLTPPGGVALDPFAGSGTTIEAALIEGFHPIGIEAHEPYIALIQQRIERATAA